MCACKAVVSDLGVYHRLPCQHSLNKNWEDPAATVFLGHDPLLRLARQVPPPHKRGKAQYHDRVQTDPVTDHTFNLYAINKRLMKV